MADKTRGEVFQENLPDLSEADAFTAIAADKIVLSFDAMPIPGEPPSVAFFAIRFALADGSVQTLALDRYAGEVLRGALQLLKDGDWKATLLPPSGLKPN